MLDKIRARWRARWAGRQPSAPAMELTPHAVLFTTPSSFDYEALRLEVYRGLLYAEAMVDGAGLEGRLLTVWRDAPAFHAAKARIQHDPALANASVLWEGSHLATREPRKPRWKRLSLAKIWAFVLTVFLVLEHVAKIRDAWGWLLGPPEIEPWAQPSLDVLVGEPFDFNVTARNTRQLGECSITFDAPSTDQPKALVLALPNIRNVPAVKPNDAAILKVSGTAAQEGRYKVTARIKAQAGFVYVSERLFETSTEVRVWRALELGSRRLKKVTAGGKQCEVEFDLRPGRRFPRGVRAQAKLERVQGVRFVGVRFRGTDQFVPHENWRKRGSEVATLDWVTTELAPMHVVTFSVLLENDTETTSREQWEAVAEAIQMTFDEVR